MKLRHGTSQCIVVLLFLVLSLCAFADELTFNLASKVIESFDDPETSKWIVRGSKFTSEGFPKSTYVSGWPEALFGRNKENQKLYCLGIRSQFDRKAYNYIELIPAKQKADGTLEATTIPLPGRAKNIDLWVWGSNHNYYMEIYLRDYSGVDHMLPLGSLLYAGWKNLSVAIPPSIPQSRRYIPRYQPLELTKLMIWTRPDEKVDDYYVYIDQIKILTDLYESRFDGDNLADQELLNQIWGSETVK